MKQQELSPRETTTIRCTCEGCDASAITSVGSANIGAIAASTKFKVFFQNDGRLAWICPACWQKLLSAFEILKAVLGDAASLEPIHFLVRRWLLELSKKEP